MLNNQSHCLRETGRDDSKSRQENVLAQQFEQDRSLRIVTDAEPVRGIVLGYQAGGGGGRGTHAIVPLTPKNLGMKTTKRVSNIPRIQVVLCGFLENCMF